MTFRNDFGMEHQDRMGYQRVTAGKSNRVYSILFFWLAIVLGVAGFTFHPYALYLAVASMGLSIVLKITSKVQRWYWRES